MKRATSLILAGALLAQPITIHADPPPKPKIIEWLADLCSIEVMGSIVVITACIKKIWFDPPKWPGDLFGPAIDPDDPDPGSQGNGDGDNDWSGLSLPKVASCPVSDGFQYTNALYFSLQGSPDLQAWTNAFTFQVWESSQGRLLLVTDAQGLPVCTNYSTISPQGLSTNRWPGLSKGNEPKLFYRLATP